MTLFCLLNATEISSRTFSELTEVGDRMASMRGQLVTALSTARSHGVPGSMSSWSSQFVEAICHFHGKPRPSKFCRREISNRDDMFRCSFWASVRPGPSEVSRHAAHPVPRLELSSPCPVENIPGHHDHRCDDRDQLDRDQPGIMIARCHCAKTLVDREINNLT